MRTKWVSTMDERGKVSHTLWMQGNDYSPHTGERAWHPVNGTLPDNPGVEWIAGKAVTNYGPWSGNNIGGWGYIPENDTPEYVEPDGQAGDPLALVMALVVAVGLVILALGIYGLAQGWWTLV